MPLWFLAVFAALAVLGVVVRLAAHRGRGSGSWLDVALVVLGALGLAYHCGSMFFRHSFTGALAVGGYAHQVAALGTASMIGYSIPAALLVLGVRRIGVGYTALVVAVLTAVGVTMYDGGPLDAHLGAIMAAAVVVIVGVVALLPLPGAGGRGSWRRAGSPSITHA